MDKNPVSVKSNVIKKDLKYNSTTVLSYQIEYPEFESSLYRNAIMTVNNFYREKAEKLQNYYENILFPSLVGLYKTQLENHLPIPKFEASLSYQTTYLTSCMISLYSDQYEYAGGAHGITKRDSQTWDLFHNSLMKLNRLLICTPDNKAYALKLIEEQANKNPGNYFLDYKTLLREKFNENSFYCTPAGIVIYYQIYDIAPFAGGIKEFLIPYSLCVTDPKMLCGKK